MLIYRFRGGRNDGLVAVAEREAVGQVEVRGRQILDERGIVVGRVVEPGEVATLPPAVAALLREPARTAAKPPSGPAPTAGLATTPAPAEPAPTSSSPRFPDRKVWRRAVRTWAIEQGFLTNRARGIPPRAVTEAWVREHGSPTFD